MTQPNICGDEEEEDSNDCELREFVNEKNNVS